MMRTRDDQTRKKQGVVIEGGAGLDWQVMEDVGQIV